MAKFPYPLEVTGGAYRMKTFYIVDIDDTFPSPFEKTGGHYRKSY